LPGDVDVLPRPAVLVPGIGNLDRAKTTFGLAIIRIDAEVEQARGVAAGAGEADQGFARAGGDVRHGRVPAVARRRSGRAIHGLPRFAAVPGDLVVEPVAGVARPVVGAEAEADQVARRGDRKGDGAPAAGADEQVRLEAARLGVEVGVDELLA